MAKKKTFENIISNLLGEPVSNLCHAFYDQYVEANVKFRSKAGMKEVIIRRQLGKCCKWCADLAGIYTPENAPDDIYRRHDNCKCMVTYKDEDGYTDVWTKKEFESQKKARISREREIQNGTSREKTKADRMLAAERAGLYDNYVDYIEAKRFSDNDIDLINMLRSGEVQKISTAVDTILSKEEFALSKGVWSGKTIMKDDEFFKRGIAAIADWDYVIKFKRGYENDIKKHIHEHLHMRSVVTYGPKYGPLIYINNINMEEGVVEYLTQEICKKKGISYHKTYKDQVKAIKRVRQITRSKQSEYGFAKELFDIPLLERYNYVNKIVTDYKSTHPHMRKTKVKELNELLVYLKGGHND